MTTSRTTSRLIIVLLFLAGILLLRKPIFGQAITAAPTRFSIVIEGVASGKGPDVILIPGLATSRDVYAPEAKLIASNYRLHLIQVSGIMYDQAATFDNAVQAFPKPDVQPK